MLVSFTDISNQRAEFLISHILMYVISVYGLGGVYSLLNKTDLLSLIWRILIFLTSFYIHELNFTYLFDNYHFKNNLSRTNNNYITCIK